MADEDRSPTDGTARARAASAARVGEIPLSIAWSLVSIADDLAALRRDSDWQRRHGKSAGRG